MKKLSAVVAVLATVLVACGGGSGGAATRTVLVDYKHDEFTSAFLSYFPKNVVVHPGDTVRFKQTWTGEPHSVTMGRVVDDFFKFYPIFEKYQSEDEARADGVSDDTIARVNRGFRHVPGMTDNNQEIYQPGVRPCFVTKVADVPEYTGEDENNLYGPAARCPTEGQPQPPFTGRQALYNSGYIPWQGSGANSFVMPIAQDATPGTYTYFCNYHWIKMSGTVKIVPTSKSIPSNSAVNRLGLKEIRRDASRPLAAVKNVQRIYAGRANALAGTDVGDPYSVGYASANEFFPAGLHTKVGRPITWSFEGLSHTVSFNVPAYFPVFTIAKNGDVHYDKRAQDPVRWAVPKPEIDENHESIPRAVDVGGWDGGGGFHSSGLLNEGDTFSITFTKPGTYPYACVIHPPMIGTVVVAAA